MGERVLVNFFYAHPVGHAIEALHYAHGHHVADPEREVHVALSARTPVELAACAPFVYAAYAIDHLFLEPRHARPMPLPDEISREWDWVLDNHRRHEPLQTEMFPGMRDWYAACDQHLTARNRSVAGSPQAGYVPRTSLRLNLPADARARAAATLGESPAVAVLPGGSGDPALYPSAASWTLLLNELTVAHPRARMLLVGKLAADGRTTTNAADAIEAIRRHDSAPVDAVNMPLMDQLALVEQAGVLVSPHSGFGMAALAVGTPWLTISGGRWFEFYFNHVPFRSVIPDTAKYPAYTAFEDLPVADGRTPSMSDQRIREDADRIVAASVELMSGTLDYDRALEDYYGDLLRVIDPASIWSTDNIHACYV